MEVSSENNLTKTARNHIRAAMISQRQVRLNLNMNDDDHERDDFSVRFNEVDPRMEDDTIEEAVVAAESLLREPRLPYYGLWQ